MRTLLLILLSIVILLSCKEDSSIVPAGKTVFDIKFDLSGFARQVEDMQGTVALKATPPDPHIFSIQYMVYDASSGGRIRHLWTNYLADENHTEVNSDFGVFSDKLPEGNYKIVFLGTSGCCGFEIFSGETYGKAYLGESYYLWTIPDIFYQEIDLKVTGDLLMDTLMLERMTGNIDIRLTDENFPENLRSISVYYTSYGTFPFSKTSQSFQREFFVTAGGDGLSPDERWLTEKAFDMHVIPDKISGKLPVDLRITARNTEGDIIVNKDFENISVERNKRVVLTGTLFDNQLPANSIVLTPDTAFCETEIIEF